MNKFCLFAAGLLVALALQVRTASAIDVQPVTTDAGITAWLSPFHSEPIVAVKIAFRGGSSEDPVGLAGLSYLMSGLLDEGAGDLDSQAFQLALEDHAIRFSARSDSDHVTVTMTTLTEHVDEAFKLLGLALTRPEFDRAAVERIRQQILASIKRQQQNPGNVAGKEWQRRYFGDHPYARPADGSAVGLLAVRSPDLHQFAADNLTRDRMLISVAGDVTADRLADLLDDNLAALPAQGGASDVAKFDQIVPAGKFVVKRQIPQSVVIFGHRGLPRSDPDWYSAYVMNYILGGGGFSSRLTAAVREQRGLAYSVYSYLSSQQNAAVWRGRVSTRNDQVATAMSVIRDEISRLRDGGVTAQELADAKTYLIGSFPLQLDSNSAIASFMLRMQIEGLTPDYLNQRKGLIGGVTSEDVARVARRLLQTDQMLTVIVGAPTDD